MASRTRRQSAAHPSTYSISSDSESSELEIITERTERGPNDLRLQQAIRYMKDEGGSDTPELFMQRINLIDEDLLQQFRRQRLDYDPMLFREVSTMVHQYQREYDEAEQELAVQMDESDTSHPEYHAPQALNRADSDDDIESLPKSASSPSPLKSNIRDTKAALQRTFKYGGPRNEPETWHQKFPALLPFPETPLLARWESLQIAQDLARGAKGEKSGPEIIVSFSHYQLEAYKNLEQYDSGSRFKLPVPTPEVQRVFTRLGSVDRMDGVVGGINEMKGGKGDGLYAPRVFLEKFSVGPQIGPTAIRRAVNTSPSIGRQRSGVSEPSVTKALGNPFKQLLTGKPTQLPTWSKKDTPVKPWSPSPPPPAALPAVPKTKPQPKTQTQTQSQVRASPVARRISAHRAEALRTSAPQQSPPKRVRRQSSLAATQIASPIHKPLPRSAIHRVKRLEVRIPEKRGPGRPRKNPVIEVGAPAPVSRKRKRSEGSQYYTPDGRRRSVGQEEYVPMTTKLRSATGKGKGKGKVVHWSGTEDEDEEEDSIDTPPPPPPPVLKKRRGKGKATAAAAAKKPAAPTKTKTAQVKRPAKTPSPSPHTAQNPRPRPRPRVPESPPPKLSVKKRTRSRTATKATSKKGVKKPAPKKVVGGDVVLKTLGRGGREVEEKMTTRSRRRLG